MGVMALRPSSDSTFSPRRARPPTPSPRRDCAPPRLARAGVSFGPSAKEQLGPALGEGRVFATGLDTWSLCWYGQPGSALHCSLRALATQQAGRALLLPERVLGHRVGWFPDHGLVFAEGRLGPDEGLCRVSDVQSRAAALIEELGNLGIPIDGLSSARVRRLDVAADLWTGSSAQGQALLECVGTADSAVGKVVTYRLARGVQSVVLKSNAGRSQARIYDKGSEEKVAERGRWIRFEAQWRFGRAQRLCPEELNAELVRARFQSRFKGLKESVGGFEVGGVDEIATRLGEAVEAGRMPPSRARSVAGYLLLSATGVPQGAQRTVCELERECRELGLSLSLLDRSAVKRVDVATMLEECLAPEAWEGSAS
jgi:hypothetical protein